MIEYVVRSGDGFLVSPDTMELISSRSDPACAAMRAKRYRSVSEAEQDVQRLSGMGFMADVVELHVGKLQEEPKMPETEEPTLHDYVQEAAKELARMILDGEYQPGELLSLCQSVEHLVNALRHI